MTGSWYNGYDWRQRNAILTAYKRGVAGESFTFAGKPCGLCGDPDRPPNEWHSEDYSQPFCFDPPATYPICKACHGRLHKRFNRPPEEWELFCRHIEAGGYGREFIAIHGIRRREALMAILAAGKDVDLPRLRETAVTSAWWRTLSLDAETIDAAWARPRPWRPRPEASAYRKALVEIGVSNAEWRLMLTHASAPNRSATMRKLAQSALDSDRASTANLLYGRLAHRLCNALQWSADIRPDGTTQWMSAIGEGWQPPRHNRQRRDYEWVMISALAEAVRDKSMSARSW